jgi:anti-anti-sigma factor
VKQQGVAVIPLSGDIDIVQRPTLTRKLLEATDNRDAGLVVDLTDATYIDSAGVHVLFEVAEALTQRQLKMALVVAEGSLVERVVDLVDLRAAASLHRTVESAVEEVGRTTSDEPADGI